MKLYVCWGTFLEGRPPCADAHAALRDAGHAHDVVRSFGWGGPWPTPAGA